MLLIEERTRTNSVLVFLMSVLGLSAIFENALNHELIYYASFAIVPLTLLLLLRNVPGNGFHLGMHLPLFILIISSGLTLLWTINLNETMGEFYKLILYLLIYWLAAVHLKPNDVGKLIAFLILLGSMIALVGILSFLFIEPVRITSLFNNPNPFGIYLAMLSLMGCGLFIRKSPTRFLPLALVLITDALILTGSRGSLISFVLSFPVIFLNSPKDKLKNEIKKFGVMFLMVGISVYIISIVAPRMQDAGWELNKLNNLVLRDSSWGSTSVEGRLSFWLVAWNMIKERPLTGFGLGTYHLAYNTFRNNDHYWSMFAHNHYLQLWAEAGIFALIGFLTFFLVFIIRSFNYRNTADKPENYFGVFAAILAFLLHLAVDFTWNMPPVTLLFWTLLGCQMALLSSGASAAQNTKWVKLFKYAAVTLALFLFFGCLQQMAGFKCAKIAVMQENNGQIQMAANWYEKACKVFPWRAEYFSRYADLLYQQWYDGGQREILKKAIELKEKAISLSPYDYFNYHVLGKILWEEKIDGAEYYLQKAVIKAGFTPEPYNDLGYFYLANNKPEAAVEIFETGISRIPFAWKNAPGEKEREKIKMIEKMMGIGLSQAHQELLILKKRDN